MFGVANVKTPSCGKQFTINSIKQFELGMVLHILLSVKQSNRCEQHLSKLLPVARGPGLLANSCLG